jgi:hypothetical protein
VIIHKLLFLSATIQKRSFLDARGRATSLAPDAQSSVQTFTLLWPRPRFRPRQAAYFMTEHDLVTDLGRPLAEGRLDRRLRTYIVPKVHHHR